MNPITAKLLNLAAKNDVEGFTKLIDHDVTNVDQIGEWNVFHKGSTQVVPRTPLMVAAMYGSLDVIKKILSLSRADVNRSTGIDHTTALHCAASSGSENVVDVVRLLLAKGADANLIDANGLRPVDMIGHLLPELQKAELHMLLKPNYVLSRENEQKDTEEYFMMYSFKVRQCFRFYSHDYKQCPFTHRDEDARRRDPNIYPYSCVPCSQFTNARTCSKGDLCEFAHGCLESGLHPTRYRTQLCNYGTSCNRSLCFFAHKPKELRNVGSPSVVKPPQAPLGYQMFNWQQPNVPTLVSPHISDQSMFSPRNNMSNLNQFQSMASVYQQHQQPHVVRSLSSQSQELGSQRGSTSVEPMPWSEWGSSSGKPDWAINKDKPNFSFFHHVEEGAEYDGDGSRLNKELEDLGFFEKD